MAGLWGVGPSSTACHLYPQHLSPGYFLAVLESAFSLPVPAALLPSITPITPGPSQTPLAPSCLLALPSSSVLHGDRGQGTGTQTLHGSPQLQNPQWLLCTGEEETTHPRMLYFSDKSANFNTPRVTGRRTVPSAGTAASRVGPREPSSLPRCLSLIPFCAQHVIL